VPGFGILAPSTDGNEAPHVAREPAWLPNGFAGRAAEEGSSTFHAAVSSTKPAASTRASFATIGSTGANARGEKRDYFWLLQAIQECCPAADPSAPEEQLRKPLASVQEGMAERVRRIHVESLLGKCGFKIPDTVILKNGKPRKRFSLDSSGRMQVETLNSSAQLLRVLRRYVQIAQKARPVAPAVWTDARNDPRGRTLNGSHSEPSLRPQSSPAGKRQKSAGRARGTEPYREAAVLYYADGAVRYMTVAEAVKQMENVSRLPKEFWQHIVMLQMPVQPSRHDATTRYITYNFDAASEGFEPQAPLPLVHRRSNSLTHLPHNEQARGQEGSLVGAIPRKINNCLTSQKGKYGNGMSIVNCRFEFVLDEADGTLWLINAEKVLCEQQDLQVEDCNSDDDEIIRYFKEDEFRELMQNVQKKYDDLKDRWQCHEEPGEDGEPPQFVLESRNAADRLAGVKHPEELLKYHQAEGKMKQFYFSEIKSGGVDQERAKRMKSARAAGKAIWFKRWVKGHRRGRRGLTVHKGPGDTMNASQSARQETTPFEGNQVQRVQSAGPRR
jgi:hypothetical protein